MTTTTTTTTVVACTLNSHLLSGNLGVIAVVDVQLTRLRRLNQGTLTLICFRKNLNTTVLQVTCTREFFFLFLYRYKSQGENLSIQHSSSSTNILYLNILYTRVGVGKIYGHRCGHREQSRE